MSIKATLVPQVTQYKTTLENPNRGDVLSATLVPQVTEFNVQLVQERGPTGAQGADGAPGADGVGVPAGGSVTQILKKQSGTDFDTAWEYEWSIIALNWNISAETAITGGTVLTGSYDTVGTIYRYITDAVDANGYPTTDGFYTTFDGTNPPTGTIVIRNT